MFIEKAFENPALYIGWIVLVGFSICVHEYAHAYAAYRLGDDTAAEEGHLSLNPLVQMGPMSLVMLFLLGIAWGMVPVNTSRLKNARLAGVVAFAGPASNLVLSAIFSLAMVIVAHQAGTSPIVEFMSIGAVTNGALFVLNLIPIPPLDGYQIIASQSRAVRNLPPEIIRQASFILILLIFLTNLFTFVWIGGDAIAMTFEKFWLLLLPF